MEAQAVSRVLRIGQTKETHVYRLIVRGTIEEQILQMQQCNTGGGGGGGGGDDAADGRSSGADGAVTSSTGLVSTLDAPPPAPSAPREAARQAGRAHRGRPAPVSQNG
eukprot:COSAG01_NODE_2254_length_8070_cov_6.783743_5_plen_108_part_00